MEFSKTASRLPELSMCHFEGYMDYHEATKKLFCDLVLYYTCDLTDHLVC